MNTVLDILDDLKRVRSSSVDMAYRKGSVEESFASISLVSMMEDGVVSCLSLWKGRRLSWRVQAMYSASDMLEMSTRGRSSVDILTGDGSLGEG